MNAVSECFGTYSSTRSKDSPFVTGGTVTKLLSNRVLACEMGRPVLVRMVHCDPVRLSEEQADEYEPVVHPGASRFGHTSTVRLYVS